jgi:riboflavin kinase/FMN adenylyltransferase
MTVVRSRLHDSFPAGLSGGAVAIGNFDGVHRGHAALLALLSEEARRAGGPAVAVTFDPHPLRLLTPDRFQIPLTTIEDRAEALRAAGADAVVVLETTPELLSLSADDFLRLLLLERVRARAVVEGFNFCFGKDRLGNADYLKEWCGRHGLVCRIVAAVTGSDGQSFSSSRVRAALVAGQVGEAAQLLGRPYRLRGTVVPGQRRGSRIGVPTANLGGCETLVPGGGVYAVRALVGSGTFDGVANVGANPTFGESEHKLEVHLLGDVGDLYGQPLAVEFVARVRDTIRFNSVAELTAQISRDITSAKNALLIDRVRGVLAREVGPALAIDGAAVEVLGIENGVARVRLAEVCASCPATLMTMVFGIEQELRRHVPEIEYLEASP